MVDTIDIVGRLDVVDDLGNVDDGGGEIGRLRQECLDITQPHVVGTFHDRADEGCHKGVFGLHCTTRGEQMIGNVICTADDAQQDVVKIFNKRENGSQKSGSHVGHKRIAAQI